MDAELGLPAAIAVLGLSLASGVMVVLSLLWQRRPKAPRAACTNAPARGVQTWIGAVLLVGLVWVAILMLMSAIAQSDRWKLPRGRLLETVLSACQFEHSKRAGIRAHDLSNSFHRPRFSTSASRCCVGQRRWAFLLPRCGRPPLHSASRLAFASGKSAGGKHNNAAACAIHTAQERG